MPHNRHKGKGKDSHKPANRKESTGEAPAQAPAPVLGELDRAEGGQDVQENPNVQCCIPGVCEVRDLINTNEPGDCVKVLCNNENCNISGWMHPECFSIWEESVLSFLRSCGRARSWSEKQRLQNLWTKKGYDLAYKACDCICGRGHLRKDLDYFPKPVPAAAKKKHKKNSLPTLTVSSKGHHQQVQAQVNVKEHNTSQSNAHTPQRERINSFGSGQFRERVDSAGSNGSNPSIQQKDLPSPRDRSGSTGSHGQSIRPIPPAQRNRHCSAASMTSTGSSPPNSSMDSPTSSSSPGTPCTPVFGRPGSVRKSKFDFGTDPVTAMSGNMFRRRDSLNMFTCLPKHKRNPYHIKMEDDGPHGNDETRNFLMSNLSSHKATNVHCLLCRTAMPVFDRYPLIDGTFFLSPMSYDEVVSFQVEYEGKSLHLHAVCILCLEGAIRLLCQFCNQNWNGSTLVLGTMYTYDIFAAHTCCDKRFTCKKCAAPVISEVQNVHYFSEFSRMIQCPRCQCEDHHFVKPLQELYYAQPICN